MGATKRHRNPAKQRDNDAGVLQLMLSLAFLVLLCLCNRRSQNNCAQMSLYIHNKCDKISLNNIAEGLQYTQCRGTTSGVVVLE